MSRTELTRRALVAGAATVAATTTPAAVAGPAEPDPVFALIEAHKAALHDFRAYLSGLGVHETPEQEAETCRLSTADDDAAIDLGYCTPTTMAGVIALLRYVAELGGSYGDAAMDAFEEGRPLFCWVQDNCADALEDMAVQP